MNIVPFKTNGLVEKDSVYHFDNFSDVALLLVMPDGSSYFYKFRTTALFPKNAIKNDIKGELKKVEVKYVCPKSYEENLTQTIKSLGFNSIKGRGFTEPLEVYVIEELSSLRVGNAKRKGKAEIPHKGIVSESITPAIYPRRENRGDAKQNHENYKILIVDDSKTIRKILRKAISEMNGFEVIAETGDPTETKNLIRKHQPDAMTLDLHMPNMTGVEVLDDLGEELIPTIVVSSISLAEGDMVIKALEMGAFDYLQKPTLEKSHEMFDVLKQKLEIAVQQKGRKQQKETFGSITGSLDISIPIFMGASTGGTEAIKDVLLTLPSKIPPILIVQHIPPYYSKSLANRLNDLCPFTVKEAEDGDLVEPGVVLIAPGGFQMEYVKSKGGSVRIFDGDTVNGHKPSVDVLFDSAAKYFKADCIGVIMTGMGKDGAAGMKRMFDAGALTIAQDQESCVVYGMPKAAVQLGAATKIKPLGEIGQALADGSKKIKKSAS